MPRNSPERELARECTKLLELDGFRTFWMEPVSRREWGRGTGEVGQPDALYIRYDYDRSKQIFGCAGFVNEMEMRAKADVLFIEYKSRAGRTPPSQKFWHERERARGALTAIAKIDFEPTVDGFLSWYLSTGLARRIGALGRTA
jgi:hypothetical protein